MLERLMKLYVLYMLGDVRSPLPHMYGPPGCGKSWSAEELARLVGVNLHIINVSRLSPLEVEGMQMPVAHADPEKGMVLKLLTATFWTQLKEGDILLLDEFLRAFPEVYNALLDILTSREVGGYKLPKVFIIAASNTTVAYDKALEDRLLHLPAADPRKNKKAKEHMAKTIVEACGLHPDMVTDAAMVQLLDLEVLPMFKMLDSFGKGSSSLSGNPEGRSVRKLIGMIKLRELNDSAHLKELIDMNNSKAIAQKKYQYLLLPSGKVQDPMLEVQLEKMVGNARLTEIQAINVAINLQLIGLEKERLQNGATDDTVPSGDDDIFNPAV